MSKNKDYLRIAKQYGFVLVRTKRHLFFKHPSGAFITCPATPSDSKRGIKNFESNLTKALQAKPVIYCTPKR